MHKHDLVFVELLSFCAVFIASLSKICIIFSAFLESCRITNLGSQLHQFNLVYKSNSVFVELLSFCAAFIIFLSNIVFNHFW